MRQGHFRKLVNLYLDGELAPRERIALAREVAHNPARRAELDAYRHLHAATAQALTEGALTVVPDAEDEAPPRPAGRRAAPWLAPALGMAAALALGFFILPSLPEGTSPSAGGPAGTPVPFVATTVPSLGSPPPAQGTAPVLGPPTLRMISAPVLSSVQSAERAATAGQVWTVSDTADERLDPFVPNPLYPFSHAEAHYVTFGLRETAQPAGAAATRMLMPAREHPTGHTVPVYPPRLVQPGGWDDLEGDAFPVRTSFNP